MGHVVGGSLLIAGTTIGVGMLALPVATGPGGFVPAVITYFICWLFMLCTGLLFVEATLWMPQDTSFISMADKILGPVGKIAFWLVYLFLFVTVMIAHVANGGEVVKEITGWGLSSSLSAILYTAAIAPVVYLGARSVDRLNMLLISGLAICYLAFIAVSFRHVDFKLLQYSHWERAWLSLPILFTAFTYQLIIPTLATYMERNVHKMRLALFFGTLIPLAVYLIWEFLILGIVPSEGPNGLIEAAKQGQNAVGPLKQFTQHPWVFQIGKYFSFFALTTSFIPLALAFFDFLADGLKWKKKGIKRVLLCLAIFGVPLVTALRYPQIFLVALGYAGGISCAFLFGLMPPLMAWIGRYRKHLSPESRQLIGGKPLLFLLMAFAVGILLSEIVQQIQQ